MGASGIGVTLEQRLRYGKEDDARYARRVLFRRGERNEAREDYGSVHCTLSKSDRRFVPRSSLNNTLSDVEVKMQDIAIFHDVRLAFFA